MWELQFLTTLRACMACYRDIFTFLHDKWINNNNDKISIVLFSRSHPVLFLSLPPETVLIIPADS
jgi:hypothetical protein